MVWSLPTTWKKEGISYEGKPVKRTSIYFPIGFNGKGKVNQVMCTIDNDGAMSILFSPVASSYREAISKIRENDKRCTVKTGNTVSGYFAYLLMEKITGL